MKTIKPIDTNGGKQVKFFWIFISQSENNLQFDKNAYKTVTRLWTQIRECCIVYFQQQSKLNF